MQVRVPTKACNFFFLLFFSFFYYNVTTTLQQPCHNLAATSPQHCNKVVTVSIPWFLQPCGNLAARLWWTTLLQGCSKLVTLVWGLLESKNGIETVTSTGISRPPRISGDLLRLMSITFTVIAAPCLIMNHVNRDISLGRWPTTYSLLLSDSCLNAAIAYRS